MFKNQVFASKDDTILFCSSSYVLNKDYSNPSFNSADECVNGVYLKYFSSNLNFEFNAYFIVRDESKGCEASFYPSNFKYVDFFSVDNINNVDTIIYTNYRGSTIDKIEIKNGWFYKLKNRNGIYINISAPIYMD